MTYPPLTTVSSELGECFRALLIPENSDYTVTPCGTSCSVKLNVREVAVSATIDTHYISFFIICCVFTV